jgi:DNA-binding transcriptional LysR family regulator
MYANHPLARSQTVEVHELEGQVWVASRSDPGDSLLGVWPGLAERPDVRYVVRDWLAKLRIVAAGLAITTLAPIALDALPDGIKVVAVRGEPRETRRVVLARRPGPIDAPTAQVAEALVAVADGLPGARTGSTMAQHTEPPRQGESRCPLIAGWMRVFRQSQARRLTAVVRRAFGI